MSVMGFQKKSLYGGWVGGVSSFQVFLDFLNLFNFAKPLSVGSSSFHPPSSSVSCVA